MRLGAPVYQPTKNPEEWAVAVKNAGYRASYCPVGMEASEDEIRAYEKASRDADIVIAEVGAWSNPLSLDEKTRKDAILCAQKGLALADRIGAKCCVNIAGARGEQWDGPYPDNLSEETFELIVESVREIIDAVQPTRSAYTLETMPWVFPDSPESYLRLVIAIDRKGFGVHLDPVNLICSPRLYFNNGDLLRSCFETLGPYIKSCHAKDITLSGHLTLHLDEARPGLGALDYRVFLEEMNRLDPDTPMMLEHLPHEEDYVQAADFIRGLADEMGLSL